MLVKKKTKKLRSRIHTVEVNVKNRTECGHHSTHCFAAFTDDPASRSRGNLNMRLQLDLLLRCEKVLLLQLPKYPTLGLE